CARTGYSNNFDYW
nr:immunoglobulin heavy chain junction region [Mus musculus]